MTKIKSKAITVDLRDGNVFFFFNLSLLPSKTVHVSDDTQTLCHREREFIHQFQFFLHLLLDAN